MPSSSAPDPMRDIWEVPAGGLDAESWRNRIVVGVDGSFGADRALRWAAKQAADDGAVLDVVSVWEDLGEQAPALPALDDDRRRIAGERLQRALETFVRCRERPEHVITAPLHGPPGEQLVERARDARLLVLGTTGISSPEIPGGIGLYCIRRSVTPVVFVPDGFVPGAA
ncbi:universal stress protein [Actinomadura hibisca]|uniref:universal stress protein n=1 Tax=Actinomadura hibisca TaxID=68565 RepID=UPI000A5339BB|nr:universal stress protein [Actinomadura hibisca]